jgi:hypothetical protein
MKKPGDYLSPTGRWIIYIVTALVALALLVFFLWRPIQPVLDKEPFGAPQPALPAAPSSGGD